MASAMWATPSATDGLRGGTITEKMTGQSLPQMVNSLPPSQITRDNLPGYLMREGEPSGGQLNPDWVEWLMNWPIKWTSLEPMNAASMDYGTPEWWDQEPEGVPRVANGVKHRVNRLKAIGNGQVPLCAALAWSILSR